MYHTKSKSESDNKVYELVMELIILSHTIRLIVWDKV